MRQLRAVLAAVLTMMAMAMTMIVGADVRAGTVTFDTDTEAGSATLTFRYDDDALRDRLRFRRNQLDAGQYFSLGLTIGGRAYDLTGALGGTMTLDRRAGTLTYIASDAALDAGAPVSRMTLFFGGRVRVRRFSDLISVLSDASPEQIELMLTEAVVLPVPVPAAVWLFGLGAGGLVRLRLGSGGRS